MAALVKKVHELLGDLEWWNSFPDNVREFAQFMEHSALAPVDKKWATCFGVIADFSDTFSSMPAEGLEVPREVTVQCENKMVEIQAVLAREFPNNSDAAWSKFYMNYVEVMLLNGADDIAKEVRANCKTAMKEAQKVHGMLMQVRLGGARGSHWAAEKPADLPILEWFSQSLAKVAAEQLEKLANDTEVACKKFTSECGCHATAFPDVNFRKELDVEATDMLEKVEHTLREYHVTKGEWLLGSALFRKGSSKLVSRLKLYTDEVAENVKGQWEDWVHPELVVEINRALTTAVQQ